MTEDMGFLEWLDEKGYGDGQYGFKNLIAGAMIIREKDIPIQMFVGYYIEYLAEHEIYVIIYVDETIEQYALRLESEIEKL